MEADLSNHFSLAILLWPWKPIFRAKNFLEWLQKNDNNSKACFSFTDLQKCFEML